MIDCSMLLIILTLIAYGFFKWSIIFHCAAKNNQPVSFYQAAYENRSVESVEKERFEWVVCTLIAIPVTLLIIWLH